MSVAAAVVLALLAGCGEKDEPITDRGDDVPSNEAQLAERLSGTIRIDGPRVLQPLSNAAASNFETETDVKVKVERYGTEAAFDKLCTGRIDVAGARRPMNVAEEKVCQKRGIEVQQLKIANHAVAVATSRSLHMSCLRTEQLQRLWAPSSPVVRYSELGPGLPQTRVELFGAPTVNDSFALFTMRVNERAGAVRSAWRPVANRAAFSARLRENTNALGFYNFAQLTPVTDIRFVAVDDEKGCVEPTESNIQSGRYPLQEDLYLYVAKPQLESLRLRSFMQFFVENYPQLAATAPSIVPATNEELARAERQLPEAEIPAG